jgi:hypothetical protein
VFHWIYPHILPFSICTHNYFCLYGEGVCNCHSIVHLVRRLTILHKVQFIELSKCFLGFLSMCDHFQYGATFILAHNALLDSMAKKHVIPSVYSN